MHDGVGGTLNPQQTEIMRILRENSLRLQNMIENLLNYTELQFNASTLNLSLITLKVEIEQIIQAHALSISQKNIIVYQIVSDIAIQSDQEKFHAVIFLQKLKK